MRVRTLVPLTHPTTGENFAVGTEVDVADEIAADWRADGKVATVAAEESAEQPGNYSARTGRAEVGEEEKGAPK